MAAGTPSELDNSTAKSEGSNNYNKPAFATLIFAVMIFVIYNINIPGLLAGHSLLKGLAKSGQGDFEGALQKFEKALSYEFKQNKINFRNQFVIKVKYENLEIGNQRVDFIVEDEVVVEIKSTSKIIELFEHQLLSYLKTGNKRVGLILNFGRKSLEIKRIVNKL